MKTSHRVLPTVILAPLLCLSCSTSVYREVYPTLVDGRYDSEFPYRGCSAQLEEIGESVKMINSIAYYRTYTFDAAERIRPGAVTDQLLRSPLVHSVVASSQASGTATIITCDDRHVVLLTCAHVVGFPDTITSFHIGADHHSTGYIHTISFKEKQTNYIAVFPEGESWRSLRWTGIRMWRCSGRSSNPIRSPGPGCSCILRGGQGIWNGGRSCTCSATRPGTKWSRRRS